MTVDKVMHTDSYIKFKHRYIKYLWADQTFLEGKESNFEKENQRGIPPPGHKDMQSTDIHGKTTVWTITMTNSQTLVIYEEYRYSLLVSKNLNNKN